MSKPDTIDMVRQFHECYEQPVAETPSLSNHELNVLRVKLLAEEVGELAEALGVEFDFELNPNKVLPTSEIDALDALTDIQYVLDGAYLSLGFAGYKYAAFAEVHASNLSKLGLDMKPIKREDGKVLKGPMYVPPDLAAVLKKGT